MSRRAFVVRVLALILGTVAVGLSFLIVSVFFLLDLGPEARRTELVSHITYGVVSTVILNALVFWRLRSVLHLLQVWERGEKPDEALLRRAQRQALTFPNRFTIQVFFVVLAVDAVAVYIDVSILGYQLAQDLINAALVIVFALGMGVVVDVGLRMLLRPILRRIPLPPASTLRRFPVWFQISLMTALVSLVTLFSGGVFAYSSALNAMEQGIADERARWLQNAVIPALLSLPVEQRLDYVTQLSQPGEELFFLNDEGRIVERELSLYDLAQGELGILARATEPYLYKQDFSDVRVLVVPFVDDQVLCVAYASQVNAAPMIQRLARVLVFASVGGVIFALIIGFVIGASLSYTIRDVSGHLEALAAQDASAQHTVIAQTSLGEVGDLVQAVNHVRLRADEYTAQLQLSISELEKANEQRRKLLETMVGLTAPVIPVTRGLVVVPLSGHFDVDRAAHIRPNLLAGIASQRAQIVVIDLTGITEASEALADHLVRAARSAALMGCQVVLTGATPDVAWALMQMETGIESLVAHRDLEQGLAYAYARLAVN